MSIPPKSDDDAAPSAKKTVRRRTRTTKPKAAKAAEKPTFKLHEVEELVIEWTNYHRSRYNLPPLEMDRELVESARQHTAWMTTTGSFVHSRVPYPENIAWGQSDAESVLSTWMNSSGHRANILAGYRKIGVAAYESDNGRIYWCQQFSQ